MKTVIKQAFITAGAAVSSLYITDWFKLPQGFWAVMSAIVVMQSDAKATISASWMRIAGTFVGALVGRVIFGPLGLSYVVIRSGTGAGGLNLRAIKIDRALSYRGCAWRRCYADRSCRISVDDGHLPDFGSFRWYPRGPSDFSHI